MLTTSGYFQNEICTMFNLLLNMSLLKHSPKVNILYATQDIFIFSTMKSCIHKLNLDSKNTLKPIVNVRKHFQNLISKFFKKMVAWKIECFLLSCLDHYFLHGFQVEVTLSIRWGIWCFVAWGIHYVKSEYPERGFLEMKIWQCQYLVINLFAVAW